MAGGCPACGNETCDGVNEVAVIQGGLPPFLTRFRCDRCQTVWYDPPDLAGAVDDSGIPFADPLASLMDPGAMATTTLPVIRRDGSLVTGQVGSWRRIDPPAPGLPVVHGFVAEPTPRRGYGRWFGFAILAAVIAPVMIAAGAVAGAALLAEFFDVDFGNLVPITLPSMLDWIAGGPGAGPGTYGRYATFMIAGIVAAGCWLALKSMWLWAAGGRAGG